MIAAEMYRTWILIQILRLYIINLIFFPEVLLYFDKVE